MSVGVSWRDVRRDRRLTKLQTTMSAWVGLEIIKLPSVFHLYQAPQCDVSTNHNGELSIIFFNNLPAWRLKFFYVFFFFFLLCTSRLKTLVKTLGVPFVSLDCALVAGFVCVCLLLWVLLVASVAIRDVVLNVALTVNRPHSEILKTYPTGNSWDW